MSKLSTSFTLGKASMPHEANVEHNNREFIASNVNKSRISENITYIKQDVRDAYQQLFGQSLDEYNSKQTRRDRIIPDYFKHISKSKREEAFYEIIVQFGDSKTAPCRSENGKITQEMLDEYMKSFQKRNPNLHVFNAVLHMDEASPHLHINFIPFYTQGRKNSLSKGVSMKSALIEQGFNPKSIKENQLVAWEESERQIMEEILKKHGFEREDKQAKYAHQTVDEFKKSQDEKKIISAIRASRKVSGEEISAEKIRRLKEKLKLIEKKNEILETQKISPYKSFFYSLPEKQAFIQARLDEKNIPYRETENGFEAQECYVDEIRKIEKEFKPTGSIREKIRDDIDRLLMQSASIDELLEKLRKEKYEIKHGKYLAVKSPESKNFVRLKSLGENYSEYAIRNRIKARKKYEFEIENKINSAKKESPEIIVFRTIKFYTVAFSNGALPMRRREKNKPFSWTNDSELDKIIALNNKINSGATLETLRKDFENAENTFTEKEKNLDKAKSDLKTFYELKEKIEIIFEGKKSEIFTLQQAEETLKKYPNINNFNYHNVDILINNETENVRQAEENLQSAREKLKQSADIFSIAEKVFGGTYVQSLVGEERERRESEIIPNGLKNA
ncbi:MAG: plasmid recombination protein [Ruminococcus flavefaciens]|nr:plasmid recombination protein [Ruminococcus flavefaciens]